MFSADTDKLRAIRTLPSLIAYLRDELGWPVESDELDEMTFDWSADQLRVSDSQTRRLTDGVIRQLRPLAGGQPWGIFLVEFSDDSFHRGALREILRGLVANRRRDPSLPAWRHDNLLFICATRDYERITFAHYRGDLAQKARLATFGWQCGSPYLRTLSEFNLPALHWPEAPEDADAWRKQWASAFDKEPLTKEFFRRFDKALEAVKGDLEERQNMTSAEAYSRAQLLLERLIFLYFLKNRGWLNQRKDHLLECFNAHAEKADDFSYYGEFLERLFWSLATPPGGGGRLDGIPFLNGGLFDDDEFAPGTVRQKAFPTLKIRNGTFAFIFEHLLEAFNFTVREDTPLNQDVAVDPEMLGKVFESIVLHAEQSDEFGNAPDKRKGTGSYYTPRIVVHFICREALRQYLLTHLPGADWQAKISAVCAVDATDGFAVDELQSLRALKPADGRQLLDVLKDIKACDPAVGSGAFPVGLLHELVNLRRIAATVANGYVDPARQAGTDWIHKTKEDIVANCLYGVDIQQQAIEICRLRLWLSLIVDYDIGLDPFTADVQQFRRKIAEISQLPNLDMNFRRGDSLLDIISGVVVRVAPEQSAHYRPEYEKIHKLGLELHKAKKSERKRKLRVEILSERFTLTERVLSDELKQLQAEHSNLAGDWFGGSQSDSDKSRGIAREAERIREALKKIQTDRKSLERLAAQPMSPDFNPRLRKLEGADFDSPFNFAWRLDFADILGPRPAGLAATLDGEFDLVNEASKQQKMTTKKEGRGGFDLILGNPPFVTARNPEKRELYRERWKRVCSGKYLLVCPFFDLSFGLLRPGGQIGFIVSNAFAKREFGKPLIEDFFPIVDLQKIVDCSGLMFPGHGTPTCIVFGRNRKPDENSPIRIAATLPGGGDLRTPPEESPLWQALENQHDNPGYADSRITVADRTRKELAKWPWNIDFTGDDTKTALEAGGRTTLRDHLAADIGFDAITAANDIYMLPRDAFRRLRISPGQTKQVLVGELLRNYEPACDSWILWPYAATASKATVASSTAVYLQGFRGFLEKRSQFHKTQIEAGLQWFEYREYHRRALAVCCTYAKIATHIHIVTSLGGMVFNEHAPVIQGIDASAENIHRIAALLNSPTALFWLKQICFNKGAGQDEERDRFELQPGKVQQLPVPDAVAESLHGKRNALPDRLTALSQACWERGRQMPALAMKKLFEKPGEAYHDWNSSLPGHVASASQLGQPFESADDLKSAFEKAVEIRGSLRAEMMALQEEMDWLVYEAYGLLPPGGPCSVMAADSTGLSQTDATERVPPLQREQRPFVLWQQSAGDFEKACAVIPADWPDSRKSLWRARLECIRDNEHIRRIEQPVYKRRWDEQWKVGNRWQCGPVAYDAELADAFEWWLSEKAEYWLEKKAKGGPADLAKWTAALWADTRVQAAWAVSREVLERLVHPNTFERYFAALVKDQSVPADIPWAVPWEELEKKRKIPASVKRIRGKLNVPRERFRVTEDGHHVWAGK